MGIKIILATDEENNIGYKNELLYYFKKDLFRFKDKTRGQTVIMGRNTWDSLPKKLPNRKNVVLTKNLTMRTKTQKEGEKKPDDFIGSIENIIELGKTEDVWVIGGARLYNEMFQYADVVEHTLVHGIAKFSDTKVDNMDEVVAKHFRHVEVESITDMDILTDIEHKIEFRTYTK